MTERNVFSVDLGDTGIEALNDLVKRSKGRLSRADVVRQCISIVHQYDLITKLHDQVDRAIAPRAPVKKRKRPATEEERRVVEEYIDIFNIKKSIFWPAALSAIRTNAEAGVSYDMMIEMIRVSPNNPFIDRLIREKGYPALHVVLSEKMVAELYPMAQEAAEDTAMNRRHKLESVIKPSAWEVIRDTCSEEVRSQAWDDLCDAMNAHQVNDILADSLKEAYDNEMAKCKRLSGMLSDMIEDEEADG